jgi:hypothetical protein
MACWLVTVRRTPWPNCLSTGRSRNGASGAVLLIGPLRNLCQCLQVMDVAGILKINRQFRVERVKLRELTFAIQ